MKSSRTKNIARNITGGITNKIITIIFPFIIRTLVVKYLGADYLGLNSLITSILQVLNLSELGFSTAIVYSMYKPIADNDKNKICALLALYKKAYKFIGILIITIGVILIPFIPNLVKGELPSEINITTVYLIYLFNTLISYLLFAYKSSLLIAHQRNDVIVNINSFILGIQYVIQITILVILKKYYLYIIIMPIFTVLNNVITAFVVKKKYPQYISEGKLDNLVIKDIKKRISGLMIFRLSSATRNSFDSIFISSYIGLKSVAIYNNYYYIMNAIGGVLNVVTVAMSASIGNSIVTESKLKNYKDFRVINFVYMIISGWCTICMINLYQPFMSLWMGQDFLLPMHVVVLISMYFYALRMGDIRGVYNDASGLWWEQRYRTIAEVVSNILLNWILVKNFGITGIVAATLITIIIFGFFMSSIITFKHYFGLDKIKDFFVSHLLYAIITFIIAFIVYRICNSFSITNLFLDFIVKGIISTVSSLFLYLLVFVKTEIFHTTYEFFLIRVNLKK